MSRSSVREGPIREVAENRERLARDKNDFQRRLILHRADVDWPRRSVRAISRTRSAWLELDAFVEKAIVLRRDLTAVEVASSVVRSIRRAFC